MLLYSSAKLDLRIFVGVSQATIASISSRVAVRFLHDTASVVKHRESLNNVVCVDTSPILNQMLMMDDDADVAGLAAMLVQDLGFQVKVAPAVPDRLHSMSVQATLCVASMANADITSETRQCQPCREWISS